MEHSHKPLYTHRWIRANMGKVYKKKKVTEKVGTETVLKNKNLFRSEKIEVEKPVYETHEEWIDTGKTSDTFINIKDLSIRLIAMCNNGCWRYGYSVTNGTMIITKLCQF